MDALRPDPWLLERPVVEASEAEVGLVVVVLEEEAVPACVVGAHAERGGVPTGELPRQVPGSRFNSKFGSSLTSELEEQFLLGIHDIATLTWAGRAWAEDRPTTHNI